MKSLLRSGQQFGQSLSLVTWKPQQSESSPAIGQKKVHRVALLPKTKKQWFSRGLSISKVRCIVGYVGSPLGSRRFGQKRNSNSPESRLTSPLASLSGIDLFIWLSQCGCLVCTRRTWWTGFSEVLWQCWGWGGKGQHNDGRDISLGDTSALVKLSLIVHFWYCGAVSFECRGNYAVNVKKTGKYLYFFVLCWCCWR